jgi:hypothetical protein
MGGPLAPVVGKRGLQDALRLFPPDVLFHSAEDAEPVELPIAERTGVVHRVRQPDIGGAAGLDAAKARFGDADDLELASVRVAKLSQREPTADDAWVTAKPAHPERVAHHRDGTCSGDGVILRRNQSAERWRDAEPLKRIAGRVLGAQQLFLASRIREGDWPDHLRAHGEQIDQIARGVAEPQEGRVVERVGLGAFGRIGRKREMDQLIGPLDGKGPQNERVDERECRDARAQRQRQRRHRGAGDGAVLREHAASQAHVAHDRIEARQQLDVAALLAPSHRVAEPARCPGCGGFGGHARVHQFPDPFVEMKPQFRVQLTIDPAGAEHVGQS